MLETEIDIDGTDADERSETDRVQDERLEKVDNFFSSLQPGCTLLIERVQPSWCAGVLEEITVSDEPPDLEYFINTWGGEVLSVKLRGKSGRLGGSYKLPLKSYPPLLYGQKLNPPDKAQKFRTDSQPQQNERPQLMISHPAPSPSASPFNLEKIIGGVTAALPFVFKYLENQSAKRDQQFALMLNLANRNQSGGIGDITKVGQAMVQLNQLFQQTAGAGGGGGGDDVTSFIPQALEVVKMFLSNPAAQSKPKAKITGPVSGPSMMPTPPAVRRSSAPAATVTALNPPSNISQQIAEMPPEAAAKAIIDSLGRMPSDKRDQAISAFLTEFQADMGDEEFEDEEDDGAEETASRG